MTSQRQVPLRQYPPDSWQQSASALQVSPSARHTSASASAQPPSWNITPPQKSSPPRQKTPPPIHGVLAIWQLPLASMSPLGQSQIASKQLNPLQHESAMV